jgi:hypothetical protein
MRKENKILKLIGKKHDEINKIKDYQRQRF